MTTYKTGGIADAGIAILIGLLVGLFFASIANSDHKAQQQAEKPQTVQVESKPTEQPKPAETQPEAATSPEPKKEDCTFWRTMAFANSGKSMWAYYYTQWQACEGRQ